MRKLLVPLLALAAAMLVPSLASAGASADGERIRHVDEYQLKAEFVERFAHFVEWPLRGGTHATEAPTPAPVAAAPPPFLLCLLGGDPFGESLRRLARTHKVDDRPIELRHLRAATEAPGCQLLFVARSEGDHLEQIVAATHGAGVLTVGDSDGFAARGLLINLYVANEKIGFEVNERAARQEGFELSAKLLKLARVVE